MPPPTNSPSATRDYATRHLHSHPVTHTLRIATPAAAGCNAGPAAAARRPLTHAHRKTKPNCRHLLLHCGTFLCGDLKLLPSPALPLQAAPQQTAVNAPMRLLVSKP